MALEAVDVWDGLIALVQERAGHYSYLEGYYKGAQDLPIDATELNSKFGQVFAAFRDNLAKPIIEAAEGRVRVNDIGNGNGLSLDAQKAWERNRMPIEQTWVHKEAMIKGDAFVMVMPDQDGKGGIFPQISESCAILYNDIYPRLKDAAIKWWVEEVLIEGTNKTHPFVRVNIYFDDRIERYISLSSRESLDPDFERYSTYADDSTAWVTTHSVKQVPMFQFSVNYLLSEAAGTSDLEDSTGLLDLINKTFLDMAVASEFTAAPQRWATGVEIPLDPKTGEPKSTFKSGGDTVWTAANDMAKFGQFQSGSLASFKEGLTVLVEHLSVVSRTPQYYLLAQANWPSGEALKSTEGALRQRVQDHQDAFTAPWTDVLIAALTLDKIEVPEEGRAEVAPQWLAPNAPFATREHLEELKVHAEVLGVPEEMLWKKAGYTQAEINEMRRMREDQASLGIDVASELQASAVIDAAAAGGPAATQAGLTPDTAAAPNPLVNP
jgi:hypothetical protein